MRVVDLIEKLLEFDPNALVLVSGYEGNYESGIVVFEQVVGKYICDYHGDYDDYDADFSEDPSPVTAVIVARDTRAREAH